VTDPFAARLAAISALAAKVGVLKRTGERAKRAGDLKEWGLRHPPPDPGSSLILDDDGFMTQIGGLVHITAAFPIMNATDSLAAAAELIDSRSTSGNAHTAALLALCRSALESSAITVWLLCPTKRADRRARCLGYTQAELLAQKSFHAAEREWFDRDPNRPQQPEFQEHVRLYEERVEMLDNQPKKRPPNSSDFPTEAGKWIDQHPPAHDRELYANGFAHGVSRFYTLGSAIIHGYKWPMDYVQKSEQATFGMVADGLAAAVGMAECAVALYEVQAQRRQPPSQRKRLYPNRLQPTINDWSTLYKVTE
jgi:PAS domain-containing protein